MGKAALGGNISHDPETFTGAQGSIWKLSETLASLPAGIVMPIAGKRELASFTKPDGSRVGLVGVVLAADTAVGILKQARRGYRQPLISFVELPYGEHAASSHKTSSRLIDSVQPELLPRNDTPDSIKELTFGRGSMDRNGVNTIGADSGLSTKHFAALVSRLEDGDAGILVSDRDSTNGTRVITAGTVQENPNNSQLASFVERLSAPGNELEWSYAGRQHAAIGQPR